MAEGQLVNVGGDAWETALADREWAPVSSRTAQNSPEGPEVPVLCFGSLLLPSEFPLPDSD